MDSSENETLGIFIQFQIYALGWVFNFVVSIVGALIANGVYEVPLYQVVNVNLSVALFTGFTFAALQVVFLLFYLLTAKFWALPSLIFGVILSLLIPFAPIAAYQVYGWLGGLSISGESFVYDDFMSMFATAIKSVASVFGQLTVETPTPGATGKVIELVFGLRLETVSTLLTIVATLLAIMSHLFPKRSQPVVLYRE